MHLRIIEKNLPIRKACLFIQVLKASVMMNRYLPDELSASLPDIRKTDDLLFRAVIEKESPMSAVNALYDLIKRPIIAFDTSFKLIAYAFPRPFFFDPWEEIASTESLSDTYIYENNSLFFQEKMYHLRCSSYFSNDVAVSCPQVDGPIISDGTLLGYVGIAVANDEEVEEMKYINDRLAEALALLVTLYFENTSSIAQERLWERFLNPGMIGDDEADIIEQSIKPAYRLAILAAQSGEIPTLTYVKSCLDKSGVRLRTYIDRNEQLLVLYYGLEKETHENSERIIRRQLGEYTGKFQLYCGLSDRYHHLKDSPVARLQADIAVKRGSSQTGVCGLYSYRDMFQEILCDIAFERYGLTLCIPPIMRFEKDRDKVRGLLPTIEAFMDCDCNQEKTASYLGVHKNTISNRLHQFTELTGADPADASAMLQIKLGLMIYHYNNDFDTADRKEASDGGY